MSWLLVALCAYAVVSLVTFGAYVLDKGRAERNERRVPERTLHLLELCGGWPGGLVAQRLVRHKNRKASYQLVFWLIVASHAALWAWLALR